VDGIHGGVLALVHNSVNVSSVKRFCHYALIETLWFKIHLGRKTIQIGVVYRSPSANDIADVMLSMEMSNQVTQFHGESIIVGDFNLPKLYTPFGIDPSVVGSPLPDVFNELGLFQKVFEPTRGANILDLVLTNDCQLVTNVSVTEKFAGSDHERVTLSINIPPVRSFTSTQSSSFIYSQGDYVRMNEFLSSVNWDELFFDAVSTNDMWCIFKDFVDYAMHEYIPKGNRKEQKVRWSLATRSLYSRKTALWQRYKNSKSSADKAARDSAAANKAAYDLVAKEASASAAADVTVVEKQVLNCKSVRRFYSYVNSRLSSRNSVPPLKDPLTGTLTFGSQEKSELFQNQFCSVFTHDDNLLPAFDYRTDQRLEFVDITEQSVLRVLKSLPNKISSGPDAIPALILKNIAASISSPLTSIFCRSFETGEVPDDWLIANITPVFKNKGHNDIAANYRPISIGSVPSRAMESVVKSRIETFLREADLMSCKQHGFIKGKSIVTNVLSTVNTWMKSRLLNQSTHTCYIDFAKAFDSISHNKLLYKLERYGLCGRLLRWIRSFLSCRTQRVAYDGCLSRSEPVVSGVPQGTVLGPLLFAVFVNDLPDQVQFSDIVLYADDSKISKAISDENLSNDKFQSDLERIYRWSVLWQLPIAAQKCSVFVFGRALNARRPNYIIGNFNLEYVDCVKDLGFVISSNNKFSEHCSMIATKALKISSHIFRCFRTRDSSFLLKMFDVYVRPVVESGTSVWSPYLLKDIANIERVQRSFTKRLPGLRYLSYSERLTRLGLRSLEYRRVVLDLELTYKIIHHQCCLKFDDFFKYATDSSTRSHSLRLRLPTVMPKYLKSCFANRVPRVWNALPASVVNATSLNRFKQRLALVDLNVFVLSPF
jgi:hypothetical protein